MDTNITVPNTRERVEIDISTFRNCRLELAKSMLSDLDGTHNALHSRGICGMGDLTRRELRLELEERIRFYQGLIDNDPDGKVVSIEEVKYLRDIGAFAKNI